MLSRPPEVVKGGAWSRGVHQAQVSYCWDIEITTATWYEAGPMTRLLVVEMRRADPLIQLL